MLPFASAPHHAEVAQSVERERAGQQQDERCPERDDEHGQPHEQAENSSRDGPAKRRAVGAAEAVQDLQAPAEGDEDADAMQRLLGVAERRNERQHAQHDHREREGPEAARSRRSIDSADAHPDGRRRSKTAASGLAVRVGGFH